MREMKDSGIEWIGDIPKVWKLKRLKALLVERKEKNDPVQTHFILSLGANYGVIPYSQKEGGGNKAKEDVSSYRLAYPGDIVMNSMNIISGSVGLSKYFGCVSPVYYMFYPRNRNSKTEYYHYLFQTKVFQHSLLGLGNGILMKESGNGTFNTVRMRIPVEKLNALMLPFPPLNEQERIVVFLDSECAEIDAVLEKTRASIDEYKKLKQSVITQAVTKGIRGGRPMKDSGIEWIGEIPADWKTAAIKRDFTLVAGATPKSEISEYWDGEICWITPADYKTEDYYIHCGRRCISKAGLESCATQIIPKNCIIFSKRAPIGSVAITANQLCTNQGCIALIPCVNVDIRYYYFALSAFTEQFNLLGSGTTFKEISASNFADFKLPHLSIEEQKEIADYLDAKCFEINNLISKKEQYITEIENYKKSLIYEYVTGKKEVI